MSNGVAKIKRRDTPSVCLLSAVNIAGGGRSPNIAFFPAVIDVLQERTDGYQNKASVRVSLGRLIESGHLSRGHRVACGKLKVHYQLTKKGKALLKSWVSFMTGE